jgi:acyl-CoA synthetase (AMP-forming)/AMP-acid ligase II
MPFAVRSRELMPLRLLAQIERHARERPTAPAFSHAITPLGAADLTWSQLQSAILAASAEFADHLDPGSVLLLCSANRAEFAIAFLAGLSAGLCVFPVSPSLTVAELESAAEETAPLGLVGSEESIAALRHRVPHVWPIAGLTSLPDRSASPPAPQGQSALLLHSSGTTGLPKIVVRSGRSIDAVAQAMAESVGFRADDRVLSCVPLCHSYGIEHGLLAPAWAGSSVRLCPGFDLPTLMAELDAGATLFPGIPFIYETLARQATGRRFPQLRRAYSAGGPLPAAVRDAAREHLGITVTQLYGATEIGSVTYSDPDLPGFDPASVGRPMRGVEIRILPPDATSADAPLPPGTEGHVAIRAASMMDGYLERDAAVPVADLIDGFFATGDLGRLDAYGNLTLTGRIKLLLDVAGLKVNPLEVEAALMLHPAVSSCVVQAIPVTQTVSRLKAVVVRTPGHEQISGETLRQFLRDRLAPYKVPRIYEFRADLPRSAAGKVLRQQVG